MRSSNFGLFNTENEEHDIELNSDLGYCSVAKTSKFSPLNSCSYPPPSKKYNMAPAMQQGLTTGPQYQVGQEPIKIFLINKTAGSNYVITDDQCFSMVEGLNMQLSQFCNDWNVSPYILIYSGVTELRGATMKIFITADTKNTLTDKNGTPLAYGYHMPPDLNGNISAYICANVILSDIKNNGILKGVTDKGASVSKIISHEMLEMIIDPVGNKTYMASVIVNGKTIERASIISEVSDPVNNQHYNFNITNGMKVQVTDYVLPSWFNPGGKRPFNHNDTLGAPFALTSGMKWDETNGIYIVVEDKLK